MIYDGSETRLQPGDLPRLATTIGCTEAHLRTVIEVETSGKGFDSQRHVSFLFEPHIFYRNLKGAQLQEAIQKGLAYKFWKGPGSYPKTPQLRWQQFQEAAALNETAAICSASWGLGQIMGSEFAEAGYPSPQAMLVAFYKSEAEQVQGMINLIRHRGLDADLRNFPDMTACRHFALKYNGAAYEKNNYHNKLHDAYVRWSARLKTAKVNAVPPEHDKDSTFRIGDHDEVYPNGPIWRMQQLFKDKGYSLLVDGKFGPGTRATVLAWKGNQNMENITPDMSPADVALLIKSDPMPVAAERAAATADDLKPTSVIVQKTSLGKKLLGWTGLGLGGAQAADSSGLLDTTQSYVDKATQAKGIVVSTRELVVDSGVSEVLHLILAWKFEILVVIAIAGFFIMNQIQKRRVEMHRNAEVA